MDFDEAMKDHFEWKLKFRLAIAQKNTMDVAAISKDYMRMNHFQVQRFVFTHPPSRGRLGGGWGVNLHTALILPTHPHPNPPLEREGILQQLRIVQRHISESHLSFGDNVS